MSKKLHLKLREWSTSLDNNIWKKEVVQNRRETHKCLCPKMDVPTLFEHACFASSNLSPVAMQLVLFSVPWSLLGPAGTIAACRIPSAALQACIVSLFPPITITWAKWCNSSRFNIHKLLFPSKLFASKRNNNWPAAHTVQVHLRIKSAILDSAPRTILINLLRIVQSKSVLITINDV